MDWMIYAGCFTALLVIDFLMTRGGEVSIQKSLTLTGLYIAAALAFGGYIFFNHGGIAPASQYVTIYFLEKMLSVDNLLVMSVIFTYFGIKPDKQHTALFYGIIGAVFFRSVFILSGGWLLNQIHWLVYGFAAFLIYTGVKIAGSDDEMFDPGESKVIRFIRRRFGVGSTFIAGIIAIEVCDIMFAVDSIPASFSVSKDGFVILSANLFAVLGLRALYHAVAYGISLFEGIEKYIGMVLIFLGAEIFLKPFYEIQSLVTMLIVMGVLSVGVIRCRAKS